MSILNKLATSLKRRDEEPNIALAKEIAAKNDKKAIKELIENLSNKNKDIQNDCIKVLYETGALKPALIADYLKEFVHFLNHKNNRLQWGAMTAVATIVPENPDGVYSALPSIIDAAEKGSVITKDQAVNIFIKLASIKKYSDKAFSSLIGILKTCPTNQLPMYAENAMPVIINDGNKKVFINTLSSRLDEIEKETKRKRVEKVIKKLG